jgi:RPAP1-like, N-terminal
MTSAARTTSTNAGMQRPQRSLELSAGEKPAARVKSSARSTRGAPIGIQVPTSAAKIPISTFSAAGGNVQTTRQQANDTVRTDLSEKPFDATDVNNALTAILGSVIERPKPRRVRGSRRNHCPSTTGTSLSSSMSCTNTGSGALPQRQFGTTIPSLSSTLRYPIGTFTSPAVPSRQTSSQPSARNESSAIPITGSTTSNAASSWQSLRQASAKEAETRLAAMSRAEILDSVQEVHALLDPSTLEFLKRRGQKNTTTIHPTATNVSFVAATKNRASPQYPAHTSTHDDSLTEPSLVLDQDRQQKLQTAQLLSSIRTLDDLDAAYEALSSSATVGSVTYTVKHDDEWALACDLLRSTSSAQTLWACRVIARQLAVWQESCGNPHSPEFDRYRLRPVESTFVDHCSRCRANEKENQDALERLTQNASWPVALRCLLDVHAESLSSGTGAGMLHLTYILQSLCLLLQLRECRDHAVDVSSWMAMNDTIHEAASVYYQRDCFDDDVPTLPLSSYYAPEISSPPSSAATMDDNPATSNVADPISDAAFMPTSSTGATVDGEAFWRDPSWTLLSRMRIIPRLAQLLRQACRLSELSSERDTASHPSDLAIGDPPPLPVQWGYALSREAVIALCGILAMVCQRSPGAASAMAQHATLMDDLVTVTLLDKEGSVRWSDPSVSLVTIRLFGVLARQSRVAALSLCQRMTQSSSFILQVLGHAVSTSDDTGFSRAQWAISQWTLILWRTFLRHGMGTDILPSVLTLTAPVLLQTNADVPDMTSALIPELYSCFTAFLVSNRSSSQISGGISSQLAQDCRLIFQGTWGESLQRLAIQRLDDMLDEESVLQCDNLCFMASHLRFLNASLMDEEKVMSSNLNVHDASIYAQLITKLINSKRMAMILDFALRFVFHLSLPEERAVDDVTAKRLEACACTFLDASLSFALSLLHRNLVPTDESLVLAIKALLISKLEPIFKTLSEHTKSRLLSNGTGLETSRCRWLNNTHALVACFLGINTTPSTQAHDANMSRAIALSVFGRLNCGDEWTAAILVRNIFPLEPAANSNGQSRLTTILQRELGTSLRHQTQVTVGVNLYLTFWSLTDNDSSTLEVQSLLNADSDRQNPTSFLPIGPFWLWRLLSVQSKGPEPAEYAEVVLATVNAIDAIDLCENASEYNVLRTLSVGPKLYYLTNLCLQMGAVQTPSLWKSVEALFDVYFGEMTTDDVVELAVECRKHSEPAPSDGPKHKKPLDQLSEEDQMKAILGPLQTVDNGFAPATVKALETFADDLCSDFLENSYAQSSFAAKCVRMLLVAGFPNTLRCLVVQRILGVQHLLSLSDDDLSGLLPHFLTGGLPSIDGSPRDSPVLLDCIASSYAAGTVLRSDDIFFSSWATAMLARSLGIGMALGLTSAMKNRMTLLDPLFATRVVKATQLWLSSNGSLNDLVAAAFSNDVDTIEVSSDFARFIDRGAAVETNGV